MPDLKLSLAELYACLALSTGESLIGLDLMDRVPMDVPSRQTLYDEGEASLRTRDLLRVKRSGEAQLEAGLLEALIAMTHPDLVVLTFVTVQTKGGFRIIHYLRDGEIWRAAISADDHYLIRRIPDASEAALEIAAAACTGAELKKERASQVSMESLVELVRRNTAGKAVSSPLVDQLSADTDFNQTLANSLQHLQRHATVSFMQPTPDGARTYELLFLRTRDDCWVALQEDGSNAVVSSIDQAQSSDLLISMFHQLNQ